VTRDRSVLNARTGPQAPTSRFGIVNENGASRIARCALGALVRGSLQTSEPHLARKEASICPRTATGHSS
jgi:hypothetical protein